MFVLLVVILLSVPICCREGQRTMEFFDQNQKVVVRKSNDVERWSTHGLCKKTPRLFLLGKEESNNFEAICYCFEKMHQK